jgi:class 3 adenylate cyclase
MNTVGVLGFSFNPGRILLRQDSLSAVDPVLAQRLASQERRSIRLAGWGQAVVCLALAVMFALTQGWPIAIHSVALSLCFAGLGLLRIALVRGRHANIGFVYPIAAIEAALLAVAILYPNPFSSEPWPRQAVLRLHNEVFFLFLVAVSAFSYRTSVVIWTTVVSALSWSLASLLVYELPDTVTYNSLGGNSSPLDALHKFLLPTFFAVDLRIKEVVSILLLGTLLALVVWRGRSVVRSEINARQRSQQVERLFGRFLPETVAHALVVHEGALDPVQREATILFVDIEGFTKMVRSNPPERVFKTLSQFFDLAGEIVAAEGGVICSFQGDALMAVFNVPSTYAGYADAGIRAARRLMAAAEQRTFVGERLRIRAGLATGDVMAGLVGRNGRLDYTVYGEAVNIAARLQAQNKACGTRIMVCETTAERLTSAGELKPLGPVKIQGLDQPIPVFAAA